MLFVVVMFQLNGTCVLLSFSEKLYIAFESNDSDFFSFCCCLEVKLGIVAGNILLIISVGIIKIIQEIYIHIV